MPSALAPTAVRAQWEVPRSIEVGVDWPFVTRHLPPTAYLTSSQPDCMVLKVIVTSSPIG